MLIKFRVRRWKFAPFVPAGDFIRGEIQDWYTTLPRRLFFPPHLETRGCEDPGFRRFHVMRRSGAYMGIYSAKSLVFSSVEIHPILSHLTPPSTNGNAGQISKRSRA